MNDVPARRARPRRCHPQASRPPMGRARRNPVSARARAVEADATFHRLPSGSGQVSDVVNRTREIHVEQMRAPQIDATPLDGLIR